MSSQKCNSEVARPVGPPRFDQKRGLGGVELEAFAAELRADLYPERLARREFDFELEAGDLDGVRFPRAQADVHPLVLRVPVCVVRVAALVEGGVELSVDGGECI